MVTFFLPSFEYPIYEDMPRFNPINPLPTKLSYKIETKHLQIFFFKYTSYHR